MQQRNFHSCPLCRTPREGFTQNDVDRASQVRALGDAESDEGGQQQPFFALTIGSGGVPSAFQRYAHSQGHAVPVSQSWSVVLLPNQATGDPFRVLRTLSTNSATRPLSEAVDHDEEEEEEAPRSRQDAAALVGAEMQNFIRDQLLRPTSMPEFLEAHSRLRRET
jgi:hypothetical protein